MASVENRSIFVLSLDYWPAQSIVIQLEKKNCPNIDVILNLSLIKIVIKKDCSTFVQ